MLSPSQGALQLFSHARSLKVPPPGYAPSHFGCKMHQCVKTGQAANRPHPMLTAGEQISAQWVPGGIRFGAAAKSGMWQPPHCPPSPDPSPWEDWRSQACLSCSPAHRLEQSAEEGVCAQPCLGTVKQCATGLSHHCVISQPIAAELRASLHSSTMG